MKKNKSDPPLMETPVSCGFPSPAEQYVESPLDLNELLVESTSGWDTEVDDIETRVRTAVSALEQAGYIERGKNMPHIYASSIQGQHMTEDRGKIEANADLSKLDKEKAVTIVNSLMGSKRRKELEETA